MIELESIKYLNKEGGLLFAHDWIEINTNLIQSISKNMGTKANNITKVIKCVYDKNIYDQHNLNEGDVVFLSRYVHCANKFELGRSKVKYSSVPITQVVGVFRDELMSLDSLEILDGNILIEPILESYEGDLKIGTTNSRTCNIGKVVKVGKGGFFPFPRVRKSPLVEVGDIVLAWNNTATPIRFGSKTYLCLGDYSVVGKFDRGDTSLDSLQMINGRPLLKEIEDIEYENGIIVQKDYEYEEESTRPNNRFKVLKISARGQEISPGVFRPNDEISEGDLVVIEQIKTKLFTFKGVEYVTLENIDDVQAILN